MKPEPKPKRRLYNPTLEDVTIDVDKLGDNPQSYTLKKGDIQLFEDHVATLIEEKLVERMYWKNVPSRGRDKFRAELLALVRCENG